MSFFLSSLPFEITVKNTVKTIEITAPTKTTYGHGDTLSLEGGKIEVTYADGTKQTPEMKSDMVTETSNPLRILLMIKKIKIDK